MIVACHKFNKKSVQSINFPRSLVCFVQVFHVFTKAHHTHITHTRHRRHCMRSRIVLVALSMHSIVVHRMRRSARQKYFSNGRLGRYKSISQLLLWQMPFARHFMEIQLNRVSGWWPHIHTTIPMNLNNNIIADGGPHRAICEWICRRWRAWCTFRNDI